MQKLLEARALVSKRRRQKERERERTEVAHVWAHRRSSCKNSRASVPPSRLSLWYHIAASCPEACTFANRRYYKHEVYNGFGTDDAATRVTKLFKPRELIDKKKYGVLQVARRKVNYFITGERKNFRFVILEIGLMRLWRYNISSRYRITYLNTNEALLSSTRIGRMKERVENEEDDEQDMRIQACSKHLSRD